ncbi:hypothetical protein TL16_g02815 [Triparma laevis f. inornata]|uniref:AB hydrolase-1 domain-containing protein n=1 Tax=Triparma laevis f. inornata TaxID=1714386 RepID=A0A9W7E244_9STRA|nr:hypothetical protein TL16_g02815 [Triparma laevis f. inornata]
MTLNTPVWARHNHNAHDSDSDDENYDGYNANRGYWAYTCELLERWFCRFFQRSKPKTRSNNVSATLLVILALSFLSHSAHSFDGALQFHSHEGRKMAFRYTPAKSPARANLICVHPVGIGISSWFFNRLNLPAFNVITPDLRGCGDSEAFIPEESGMFFPLDWTRQIESLCDELPNSSLPNIVLAQGGIAPVALQLNHRGKLKNIEKVILTSPPTYKTLTEAISTEEYGFNYRALTFPGLTTLFTRVLMNRGGK